jgi:hypothetical protein
MTPLASAASLAIAALAHAQVVALWTFEEGTPGLPPAPGPTILDISENDHHGSPEGTLSYQAGSGSPVALDFRGQQSRVRVPDSPDFHLQNGFTLESYLWLDATGPSCCNKHYMIFRGDRRSARDPWWLAANDDSGLAIQVWDGTFEHRLDSDTPIPLRQWVHVAGTFEPASGTLRLYINHELAGELEEVNPPFAELVASLDPSVTLGNSDSSSEGINGVLDEARITGRALTPAEFLPLLDTCRADLDEDGELTIFDFLVFQGYFALSDARADFDGDGQLTVFDFLEFQNAFDAGCP